MAAIRRTDTGPELALRRTLHGLGLRYRKDLRIVTPTVTARPDIVFAGPRVVVFVDGCFWHSCPDHSSQPRVNTDYWEPKLRRNRERDLAQSAGLADAGWTVIRLWEHVPLDEAVLAVLSAVRTTHPAS